MIANILIVDDVPTNIQLVASVLHPFQYELSFATSGKDALKQVEKTSFDLILLDVMMPEMDGFEVAQKLKTQEKTKDIPLIFLTAKTDQKSILKAFELGAADFLSKPFNDAELLARVRTHLALKFTQDKLRNRNQELATTIEVKNKLLSIASHDLKSPLMTIGGFANLLQNSEHIQNDSDSLELLSYISKATQRMHELITELLDTAAVEMGRFQLVTQPCNLQELLQETLVRLNPTAQRKGQSIEISLQPMPKISGDSRRLKQVFDNLLSNAIKYSAPNAQLKISTEHKENSIYIRFQDQGPGFTSEDQNKLYGYFQRLSAKPTQGESSTGIGLAIVKQIAELHAGSIHLEKTSPQGSIFLLTLPITQASSKA